MTKQTFKIVDGVYVGPEVWGGALDLRGDKETLTSLGSLTKVGDYLDLRDCTSLTSLGSLIKVGGLLDLGCTSLTSLGGSLKEVGGWLYLNGCTSLSSLGSLKKVGGWVVLIGCTNLVSLGSLKEVGGGYLQFRGHSSATRQEVQENIRYYSSLPLHEALNALHTDKVQEVPLYKNILLQTLQGG
jgi:hypothetical protein